MEIRLFVRMGGGRRRSVVCLGIKAAAPVVMLLAAFLTVYPRSPPPVDERMAEVAPTVMRDLRVPCVILRWLGCRLVHFCDTRILQLNDQCYVPFHWAALLHAVVTAVAYMRLFHGRPASERKICGTEYCEAASRVLMAASFFGVDMRGLSCRMWSSPDAVWQVLGDVEARILDYCHGRMLRNPWREVILTQVGNSSLRYGPFREHPMTLPVLRQGDSPLLPILLPDDTENLNPAKSPRSRQ